MQDKVTFWGGGGSFTYQKLVNTHGNLPLWTSDRDLVACLLRAGKDNLAVPLFLQFFDLLQASEKLAVVQAVNIDNLRGKLGVLGAGVQG